jgi:hypothetical protein
LAITGPHAQDLLSLLRSRLAAPEIRAFAARGVLPLEADDRMRALFIVREDPDPDIAAAARATLAELPPDAFADFLRGERVSAEEIDTVASLTDDVLVLEQAVRHRSVSDATLLRLARTVTGGPQEALIVNQVRLLRNPALIEALYANPGLAPDGRRMLNELKEEFFDKEARRRTARRPEEEKPLEPESAPPSDSEVALLELDDEGVSDPQAIGGEGEGAAATPEFQRDTEEVWLRVMKMTVPERVKLALTGGKEERRFLIGDTTRMVSLAVLRSRGLTLNEIESFCAMRHLGDEVFYQIARKKDWIRRQTIIMALVKNPKVPLSITLPLTRRLSMRDLRSISGDRNLPEAIRTTARKTYLQRRK